jgi:hypothetical protein
LISLIVTASQAKTNSPDKILRDYINNKKGQGVGEKHMKE